MSDIPVIAILRGITLAEVEPVSDALIKAGIRYIEIPLNSPDPLTSIERLIQLHGDEACCGAGTVMTVGDVADIARIGGKLIVSPHIDQKVIEATCEAGMLSLPGVATVTEALSAIRAGATHLKLFPAGDLGSSYLKSISAVLPKNIEVYAVGNIELEDLPAFWHAGASGFGIGGGLYRPGMSEAEVYTRAKEFVQAVQQLRGEMNE